MRASKAGALFLWLQLSVIVAPFYNISGSANAATGQFVVVSKVVDGDTLILSDKRHIRLIGINTPEIGKKNRPDQPLARQAKQKLQTLVNTGNIRITEGRQNRDHHGRTLAYLDAVTGDTGHIDIQEQLLNEGLAWLVAIPPNISRIGRYGESQARAKKHKRGIWAHSYYQPREVNKLGRLDTGFQRVHGQVKRIGRSRKYIYLNFTRRFSARIAHQDWNTYFQTSPEIFTKKTVIVSGWVSKQGSDKLGMRIGHPAMIEIDESQ